MSVSNMFDPIVIALSANESGGSSGGAPDTGVMAAVYDPSKKDTYEYFESMGMYKIADVVPSLEDLTGAVLIAPNDASPVVPYVGWGMSVAYYPDLPGVVVCGLDTSLGDHHYTFGSVPESTASALGATPGLWVSVSDDASDVGAVYLVWQPK